MKGVEKIIYNELLARRSVTLTGIGTLKVDTKPAFTDDQGRIHAPQNTVLFDPEMKEHGNNIADAISRIGIEPAKAGKIYDEWLIDNCTDGRLNIDGVGIIKDGQFEITPSLRVRLNPSDSSPSNPGIKKPHKGVPWWGVILTSILVAATAVTLYHFIVTGVLCCGFCSPGEKTDQIISIVPDEIEEHWMEIEAIENEKAIEEDTEEEIDELIDTHQRYHVTTGVYQIYTNAEDYVRLYKRAYSDVDPEIIPYKDGKYIVSIFSTDDKNEAERMAARYRRIHYNSDIWVADVK